MKLKGWRLPAEYFRFGSELCYACVTRRSEATNPAGRTAEEGGSHAPLGALNDARGQGLVYRSSGVIQVWFCA